MNKKINTKQLVLLGLLMAIVVIFCVTPIGSIPIGPLVITLNVIPIAIAAVTMGPVGGLIIGTFFGLFSFLQCFGIGVPSGMGAILVDINPFFAFVQRVIPRALDGLLVGFISRFLSKRIHSTIAYSITGFSTAFLNTAFFMSALVLLFGNTDYVQELMAGKSFIPFVVSFVGINAVCEMVVCTIITGAIGTALKSAKLIESPKKAE